MTGGMDKYWIIPRVGDKELPRVGHHSSTGLLQSPQFLCSYDCTAARVIDEVKEFLDKTWIAK